MRTLIYVPVIHTSADLGSLAEDVAKRGKIDLGEEVWRQHEEIVNGFWNVLIKYFDSLEVSGFKIYQDGMVAEGEVGQRIVEEGVRSGSKNYEVIARLIGKGAILVKTEDFSLVSKERDSLIKITQGKTAVEKLIAIIKYKIIKNRLLKERDRYIAGRIAETLHQGERGIVFIGAYHDLKKRLPEDIKIIEIKDTERVREYQRLLPFYHKHNKEGIKELGRYLISEIDIS
ncbi:MAG: hypothetical protein HZC13_02275 [Nitrospirae bacterium]|nr:hypothetical protein [Nitrospirota bacterium]